jgi:hypothetical protein
MPRRSSSSETRPKKRRKTVEFVGDPEGSLPLDDDKETRPESTEDTVETESAEARFESHRLSISHFGSIGSPNMPHFDVLWVGTLLCC